MPSAIRWVYCLGRIVSKQAYMYGTSSGLIVSIQPYEYDTSSGSIITKQIQMQSEYTWDGRLCV